MTTPDYVKILKLDKLALKAKTHSDFVHAANKRLLFAKHLGVDVSFIFFLDLAWMRFGSGE